MPETLRWPVVLFDLDGTLANSIDLILASYAHAFGAVTGRRITSDEARPWIGETLAQTFGREAPGHVADLEAAYRVYYEAHIGDVTGYPGAPELLADLRAAGATMGVVTAKRRPAAEMTMRRAGVAGLIDLIGTMEDAVAHKPDPEPLLVAARKLGADLDDCVYVGDAVYDIQAARAAGMAVAAVTWGAGEASELLALKPDVSASRMDELREELLFDGSGYTSCPSSR